MACHNAPGQVLPLIQTVGSPCVLLLYVREGGDILCEEAGQSPAPSGSTLISLPRQLVILSKVDLGPIQPGSTPETKVNSDS